MVETYKSAKQAAFDMAVDSKRRMGIYPKQDCPEVLSLVAEYDRLHAAYTLAKQAKQAKAAQVDKMRQLQAAREKVQKHEANLQAMQAGGR